MIIDPVFFVLFVVKECIAGKNEGAPDLGTNIVGIAKWDKRRNPVLCEVLP
jgi:hypothetical protein